jgi:GTP cyclohydrolase II
MDPALGAQRNKNRMSDVVSIGQHQLPTSYGVFQVSCFKFGDMGQRVFSLYAAKPREQRIAGVRLRIQYACLYGTSFNASDCDCGVQWRCAMRMAARDPSILLLYFYGHEAHGLGLDAKVQYTEIEKATGQTFSQLLKHNGVKSLPNVLWTVVPILSKLGYGTTIRLMTKSTDKVEELRAYGVEISCVEKDWDAREGIP